MIKLTDVLYIKEFEMNLILVAKLIETGADIRFGKNGYWIMLRGEIATAVSTS